MAGDDKLDIIFKRQEQLQKALGTSYDQGFINIMTMALIDELMESIRETPWKPWKKQQIFNKERYKEELVGALHFFINLCLAAGFTPEGLYAAYINKNKINHKRQEDGY